MSNEKILRSEKIKVELIDARSIKPLDTETVISSVKKTGRLIVADTGYQTFGFASEVIAQVCKKAFKFLKTAPCAITLPDIPTSTSIRETEKYYPTYIEIAESILTMMKVNKEKIQHIVKVEKAKRENSRKPIKTWCRSSTITPDFVGLTLSVHNGKTFVNLYITENMVGHKLGEFAATRTFRGHVPRAEKK